MKLVPGLLLKQELLQKRVEKAQVKKNFFLILIFYVKKINQKKIFIKYKEI